MRRYSRVLVRYLCLINEGTRVTELFICDWDHLRHKKYW